VHNHHYDAVVGFGPTRACITFAKENQHSGHYSFAWHQGRLVHGQHSKLATLIGVISHYPQKPRSGNASKVKSWLSQLM